jgi:hypothetical protein
MFKKGFFIFFTSLILLSLFAVFIYGPGKDESKDSEEIQTGFTPKEKAYAYGIFASSAAITTFVLIISYYRRRNGEVYGSIDKKLLKIIIIFCKELLIKKDEVESHILQLFRAYNSKQTINLFNVFYTQSNDLKLISKSLLNTSKEAKEFLIYSLFEIAANDRLLSLEEEKLIENIGGSIRFNKVLYQRIKQSFLKSGLQEERKLIEEENRKKLAASYVPYNAYKVLGITPNITKDQLKKIYRKLAKKYHPDTFHGKSQEAIDEAAEKFQEITKAYEIIKKQKT